MSSLQAEVEEDDIESIFQGEVAVARHKYFGWTRDGHGHVIGNATVSVYEAGGNTAASIYSNNSGGTANNSVESANNGMFSFFVDDGDYNLPSQTFKLVISKGNYTSCTVDEVLIGGSNQTGVHLVQSANQNLLSHVSFQYTVNYRIDYGNSTYADNFDRNSEWNSTSRWFAPQTSGYYYINATLGMNGITGGSNASVLLMYLMHTDLALSSGGVFEMYAGHRYILNDENQPAEYSVSTIAYIPSGNVVFPFYWYYVPTLPNGQIIPSVANQTVLNIWRLG